jgi:hypothetical protein
LEAVYVSGVKQTLLAIVGATGAILLSSCTTLENRADLYSPQNYFANGPYTRMLHTGIPTVKWVFVQASTTSEVSYRGGK